MKKLFIICCFIILILGNLYFFSENKKLKNNLKKQKISIKKEKEKNPKKEEIKIKRRYFIENLWKINKDDYKDVKFSLTEKWKKIIKNTRKLHKSPTLIAENHIEKDLCAGYIWNLTENLWWKNSPYSLWLMNTKTEKAAASWELPYFYEAFWWEILVDFSKKFSLEKKDFTEKIKTKDLKDFFAKAFSKKALFWDIWFLYKNTKHLKPLKIWNYNSHISKNMWISEFEFVFSKIDKNKSNLDNFLENLSCTKDFKKYKNLLKNYKFYLNSKEIVFYKDEFYYIKNSILWEKINFKYLDKIRYKDITLNHFFHKKTRSESLLYMTCSGIFFPINIISINSRMIEKI